MTGDTVTTQERPAEAITARRAFVEGLRDVSPTLLGIIPFGLVAGFAAIEAGLTLAHAVGFSVIVFAGASQLAAIELVGDGAHVAVAIGTALVINSRMLMYSASLAPELSHLPLRDRAAAGYVLVDQAYALSIVRYRERPEAPHRLAYYFGSAAILWVSWQITTVLGALLGGAIPEGVPLGFAVPMTFLALLIPSITGRPTLAAAITAAVVATAGAPLPANLGMPIGTVTGIAVGTALAVRRARATRHDGEVSA